MRIVEILAESNTSMRLSELAKLADLPPSTALRMVNTLISCGYAYQDMKGSRGYGLTMRFFKIGQQVMDRFSIRDVAHPFLLELSRGVGESCCLAAKEQDILRYIDVVESTRNIMKIRQQVGDRVPMHCTATGKLFLTQYDPASLAELISRGLPRRTRRTLTNESALRYDLEQIARQGYAVDDEECEEGMYCVAMPVCNLDGGIIATICVSGPIYRMTKDRVSFEILPKLHACTGEISSRINGIAGRETKEEAEV